MGRNKRRTYEEAAGGGEAEGGIPCADCGCRHSFVVKTERVGEVIRRLRQCRNCGRQFRTSEISVKLAII